MKSIGCSDPSDKILQNKLHVGAVDELEVGVAYTQDVGVVDKQEVCVVDRREAPNIKFI